MMLPKLRPVRRVAFYLRVSSTKQVEGYSLQSQFEKLSAWALTEDWETARVYTDPGASGTSVAKRHGFRQMIADAEAGMFDAVLTFDQNRWARSVTDANLYREQLQRLGVAVMYHEQREASGNTPGAFLIRGINDVLAQHYSIELSAKVSRAYQTKASSGLPVGDLPFGYRSAGRGQPPTIIDDEAEAVLELFLKYITGNWSMQELADDLTSQGFRPRSKRGRTVFGQATVIGMLDNPTYAGLVHYKGEILGEGKFGAIVGEELFRRAQEVRKAKARRPRSFAHSPRRDYLLSGIAACAGCGAPVWANSARRGQYWYYRCSSWRRGGDCPDRHGHQRAEGLEAQLTTVFTSVVLPADWRELVLASSEQPSSVGDVVAERHRLERRIERTRRMIEDDLTSYDDGAKTIREARDALSALQHGVPDGVDGAAKTLAELRDLWRLMTDRERRTTVQMSLESVVVDLRAGAVRAIRPKPAFAPLFRTIAETEGAVVEVCDWRPRPDSNRRSPP